MAFASRLELLGGLNYYFVGEVTMLLVPLYLLGSIIYNTLFHPLRRYPGPKTWAMTCVPYTMANLSGSCHLKVLDLHKRYGAVVKIAPGILSFSHSNAVTDLMGHRKGGAPEHAKDPTQQHSNQRNIIGANHVDHSRMRRAMALGFSNKSMLDQQPIIMKYVDLLFKRLRAENVDGTRSLDMSRWYNYATIDIIGDLAFGESFGCLEESTYHPWVELIFSSLKASSYMRTLRRLGPLAVFLKPVLFPKDLGVKYREHHQLSEAKVRRRLELEFDRPDFITSLTAKATEQGIRLDFDELTSNASVLIVAGSETTATLLTAVTYYLAINPGTLAVLSREVRNQYASDDEIDLVNVQKLSYLRAVLDEAMRLFPPIPSTQSRVIAAGGDEIAGYFVPEGTVVDIWQWSIYHDPANFSQPEDFVPERWLGDARFAKDKRETFHPFSAGPRNCIGRDLAYFEIRLILARLVSNYDIRLSRESEGWDKKSKVYILWEKGPMRVNLIPRKA